jgi:hypothetical protein
MRPKSLRNELVFALVIIGFWGLMTGAVFVVDVFRKHATTWAICTAAGTVLLYFIRMFFGGLLFSERSEDMELPPKAGWIALGIIVAIGLVISMFLILWLVRNHTGFN